MLWSDPLTESEDDLARRLPALGVERLRILTDVGPELVTAAHAAGVAVDRQPVTDVGVVELGRWMKEQSIAITRHRHGRLLD